MSNRRTGEGFRDKFADAWNHAHDTGEVAAQFSIGKGADGRQEAQEYATRLRRQGVRLKKLGGKR